MPARRPGVSAQKSAIQRLCALQPGPAQLVLVVLGRPREEVARREERRDGVREDHLRDDAVVLELLQTPRFESQLR